MSVIFRTVDITQLNNQIALCWAVAFGLPAHAAFARSRGEWAFWFPISTVQFLARRRDRFVIGTSSASSAGAVGAAGSANAHLARTFAGLCVVATDLNSN
jgi:hypothetical protein